MKKLLLLAACFLQVWLYAQPLPHGTVYGHKPSRVGLIPAEKLETYMSKRTRISTTTQGKILAVTKSKGGWFTIDAGHGRTIAAHFKMENINIPTKLKGRTVMIEGVAQKQRDAANMQHFAGETTADAKQHGINNRQLLFEVSGLEVIR
ncbi:DUF4920 domain-containing protein [Mucilaginibacter mali]|uniref:DUF4920 domain-containing protein n=1 Tax=Mucilaginibacter mali TaxID=2740462 RepID=A0A7D4QIP6_9SPHI|nr:DUF4920 domain-containing protein [Mucilaginibacter mali]QKJ32792.1 DUF4920 domain-containing protein [Mucilaginibacter mali]